MRKGIIYLAVINGQNYIGRTLRPFHRRITEHNRAESNCDFHKAIREHGSDSIEWKILEEDIEEHRLVDREELWIGFYNSYYDGLNMSPRDRSLGMQGRTHSDETKKKISDKMKGENNPAFGKPRSEEFREKISGKNNPMYGRKGKDNHRFGKVHTKESKAKMSESQKDKIISLKTRQIMSEAHKGKKHTDESKKKMSEAKLGKKRKPFTKETRKNMSESKKGSKNSFWGKTHTPETRKKISESLKKRNQK